MQYYMVTVTTRYAIKANNEKDAKRGVVLGSGRKVDIFYGTDVHLIDSEMLHIYAGEKA